MRNSAGVSASHSVAVSQRLVRTRLGLLTQLPPIELPRDPEHEPCGDAAPMQGNRRDWRNARNGFDWVQSVMAHTSTVA